MSRAPDEPLHIVWDRFMRDAAAETDHEPLLARGTGMGYGLVMGVVAVLMAAQMFPAVLPDAWWQVALVAILVGTVWGAAAWQAPRRRFLGEIMKGMLAFALLLGAAGVVIGDGEFAHDAASADDLDPGGNAKMLAVDLFRTETGFTLPFELLSFLLFVALIGAIVTARRDAAVDPPEDDA